MLETDEVDDDFFTPVSSTSLANIFNKTSLGQENENITLKYTPPKPEAAFEKTKGTTECLFACAVYAYEWLQDAYVKKGKLGFAILNILKTGDYNLVLYDSNKITLSCTSVTKNLKITIRDNVYLSYCDDVGQYWSFCSISEDSTEIIDSLRKFNVTLTFEDDIKTASPDPSHFVDNVESKLQNVMGSKECETESSSNNTKENILSRMANMGLAVLPSHYIPIHKLSDSSESTDSVNFVHQTKHKINKKVARQTYLDKQRLQIPKSTTRTVAMPSVEKSGTNVCKNDMPSTYDSYSISAKVNPAGGGDINLFMSEQRLNSSEQRVHLNRISEKIDLILTIVQEYGSNSKITKVQESPDFYMEMTRKLIGEYEKKIKTYEKLLVSKGVDMQKVVNEDNDKVQDNSEKDKIIQEKNTLISELLCDNHRLKNTTNEIIENYSVQINTLQAQIQELELTSTVNQEAELNRKKDVNISEDIKNKIKKIMNDTYNDISTLFDSTQTYTGDCVKKAIAKSIKQVTINILNEDQQR